MTVIYVKTGHKGTVSEKAGKILIGRGECLAAWDAPAMPEVPAPPKPKQDKPEVKS